MRTQLITREGYDKLKQELDYLWREERPEVTKKVTWAASLGDRSENADYQYNKKRLREIDRRVRYLTKCLEQLKIVDYSPQQEGKVFFGAWVEVENEDGETKRFRIVGYDEIFGRKDYISIDAPMARALLKRGRGRRHRQYAAGRGAVVRERDRLPGSKLSAFPNRRQRRRLRSSPRGGRAAAARPLAFSAINPYNCPLFIHRSQYRYQTYE